MNWQTKHKFGVVTPVWGRGRLTAVWVDHYSQIAPSNCKWVMIQSWGDPDPTRKLMKDVMLIDAKNDPLGDKHNAGTQALKDLDIDALLLIPSDDFFTREYYEFMDRCLDNDYDACKIEALWFYDSETGRAIYAKQLGTGAGTMMRRDVMDKIDWKIIPDGVRKSMDANMFGRCLRHWKNGRVVTDLESDGFVGVDVKTGTAIKSFEGLWKSWSDPKWKHAQCFEQQDATDFLWIQHFPHIQEQITQFTSRVKV